MNERQSRIWQSLRTDSKRAMRKTKTKFGKTKVYNPKGTLLERISEDFHISKSQAYIDLLTIRKEVIERNL